MNVATETINILLIVIACWIGIILIERGITSDFAKVYSIFVCAYTIFTILYLKYVLYFAQHIYDEFMLTEQ